MKFINKAYLLSVLAQIEASQIFTKTPFEGKFKDITDLSTFADRFPTGEEVLKHVEVQKKMQRSKRLFRSAFMMVEAVSLLTEVEEFFGEDIDGLNIAECDPHTPNSLFLNFPNLNIKGYFSLAPLSAVA